MQIESAPKLQQTFVFVTRTRASRINQGNGGLSESAWISRGEQPSPTTATDFPIDQWRPFVELIEWPLSTPSFEF